MQDSIVKISIIMPVYNVEAYLDKAIVSVLNQSFTDFELILVNDGSTDHSLDICEKYVNLDTRVKLINQNNLGAHNARNNALKIAKGQYVAFFDSDDYVESDMLTDLYKIAMTYNSDLVVSGFNINTYYSDEKYIVQKYIPYTRNGVEIDNFNDQVEFRKVAYHNFDINMFYPPWNKLYKLSYLKKNNLTFPITYRDDFPFVISVIKDIKFITFTTKCYYNFIRKRSDSETQKFVKNLYEKREEEHKSMLELYSYWGLLDDVSSFEMISRRYIDRIIECIVNLYNKNCTLSDDERHKEVSKYFSNNNFDISIKKAHPKRLYLKLMYIPLRLKNVSLTLLMCKFINYIKGKNIRLFAKLKADR